MDTLETEDARRWMDTLTAGNYLGRGDARLALKDYQGAIADYNQVLRLDPETAATTYSKRAVARSRIGDSKGADEDRQKAASLPKKPESRVFPIIIGATRQCEKSTLSSP